MKGRIFIFNHEQEKKPVLGFDTGLDPHAFAQAKLASFITEQGTIVGPGGLVEHWLPGGVVERNGTMVIFGPAFRGEPLDELLDNLVVDDAHRDDALEALRRWIAARSLLDEKIYPPWPAGAFITLSGDGAYGLPPWPAGTVFFPPYRLVKRCLEAEGGDAWRYRAEQWTHPDLKGDEADTFTAAAMLYKIISGDFPFPQADSDLLLQDIREGNFVPLRLAAPGVDEETAVLVSASLAPVVKAQKDGGRPGSEKLAALLGSGKKAASWIRPLETAEREALKKERERFDKAKTMTVNTRRFVIRNTALIGGIAIAVLIAGLITQSIVKGNLDRPTTRGMNPVEVIDTYYNAITALDHQLMEACVIKKAGESDISMVTNFFVLSKVRQAYEMGSAGFITPAVWMEAGSPPTLDTVFGVSDLAIQELGESPDGGELRFRVSYRLFVPGSALSDEPPTFADGPIEPSMPQSVSHVDEIRLALQKDPKRGDSWHIVELLRN
ncbi:hypothetical protein AGMMS49928_05690 [Spirochaetia bacterium]|nr:hypothetical protein AGMMS49928_05690 [Spirochaetia bacterium]